MFLDIRSAVSSGGERGLLGLAFAPDAADVAAVLRQLHQSRRRYRGRALSRAMRKAPSIAGSRFDLMWPDGRRVIDQPFSNHNGGHLAFGPDGYLYIGLGDGGSGGDPLNNAQNPDTLLGKMLRIDVNVPDDDPRGYRVPEDNPFVDRRADCRAGRDLGVRPAQSLALQLRRLDARRHRRAGHRRCRPERAREEVNFEPPGAGGRNYGWRLREGRARYDARTPAAFLPLTEPIHDYPRTDGMSITGGFVYRGAALDPMFNGRYFFADFVAGRVYSIGLALDEHQEATRGRLLELTALLGGTSELGLISSFGVDADGEIYMVSYSRGRILKSFPNSPGSS